MPSLLLLSGPRTGTRFPILGDRYAIGRAGDCELVIDPTIYSMAPMQRDSVSRHHAVIVCQAGEWYIKDGNGRGVKSRHGTLVNEQRVLHPGGRALRDQDRIRICDLQFVFLLEPESTFDLEASIDHADSTLSVYSQPPDRLRVLLEIGADLTSTFDDDVLVNRTLEHLFRLFRQAERALVVFRDGSTGSLVLRAIQMAGKVPVDASFSTSVIRRCVERVEAILGNDLPGQFPESDSIGILPARSLVCAPLWSRSGGTLGAIQLDTQRMTQKFTQHDLQLLLGVAGQASLALSNVRLHRELLAAQRKARDLDLARDIQFALLPRGLPDLPKYQFFADYEPAQQVGGDYYDFIPLPGGRLAVLLGDVAGKGVPAALLMAKFGVEARVCLEGESDPAQAVRQLNAVMARAAIADSFVTFVALVLDPAAHTLTVVNAGHPSPLVRRHASGGIEELAPYDDSGLPIGVDGSSAYAARETRLLPGDRVVIFSDGVTEASDGNDNLFRVTGVLANLRESHPTHRAAGEALLRAVKQHSAGVDQRDDITLLVFGRVAE